MKTFKILLLSVFVTLVFHCGNPVIEYDLDFQKDIAVLFVLGKQFNVASGMMSYTQDPRKYTFHKPEYFYKADAYLNGQKFDTVWVNPDENIPFKYNYVLRNFHTEAGDTNYLTIVLHTTSDTIRGVTIVPTDKLHLTIHEDSDYYYLKWKTAPGESYEWLLLQEYEGEMLKASGEYVGTSSTAAIAKENLDPNRGIFDVARPFQFTLISYDKNLTEYKLFHKDPAGIDRHYGVFYSVNVSNFQINFIKHEITLISN